MRSLDPGKWTLFSLFLLPCLSFLSCTGSIDTCTPYYGNWSFISSCPSIPFQFICRLDQCEPQDSVHALTFLCTSPDEIFKQATASEGGVTFHFSEEASCDAVPIGHQLEERGVDVSCIDGGSWCRLHVYKH